MTLLKIYISEYQSIFCVIIHTDTEKINALFLQEIGLVLFYCFPLLNTAKNTHMVFLPLSEAQSMLETVGRGLVIVKLCHHLILTEISTKQFHSSLQCSSGFIIKSTMHLAHNDFCC